jgi:hypothetical protein
MRNRGRHDEQRFVALMSRDELMSRVDELMGRVDELMGRVDELMGRDEPNESS